MKNKIILFFFVMILLTSCTSINSNKIPFVKQKGTSCMQAQMTMVLNYYGNNYTLEDMEKISKRKQGKWTWTSQVFQILDKQGLDVEYYSTTPYFKINKSNLKEIYGEDANTIESVTDWELFYESIEFLKNNDNYYDKKLSWDKVEEFYKKGYLLIMIIDLNELYGRSGYGGHGVTITSINETYVTFHNSIGTANQKVEKELFIKAWNANGTDNDIVVVKGKK